MPTPANCRFSETHEWFRQETDGTVTMGITQHAADALTDITFVEMKADGTKITAGGTVGEATDHVVATKLLRKLRNRHDVRVRQLNDLRTTLQTRWKEGKLDPAPKQCEDLLDALIRTRSFEEGEAAS